MHSDSTKSITNNVVLRFAFALFLIAASLSTPYAANAQTTIYQNVDDTTPPLAYYGGTYDYNALSAFTTIGTASTRLNNWRVSSLEINLLDLNTANELFPAEDYVLVTFYSNINVAATGTQVVNNQVLFQGEIFNGTSPLNPLYYGYNTITASSTGGLFYLPNATNATTYGIQIGIYNEDGISAGTFDTNIHPALTYAPTVGSNPGTNIWENGNDDNPDTYIGSNALNTNFSGNYNLFLQLNAVAVPAPRSAAVLLLGTLPLYGMLRKCRRIQ